MSGATMRLRDTAHDGFNIMHRLHERDDWHGPQKGRDHHSDWHQLVTHPDAHLIAAAPDLYVALESLVEKLCHDDEEGLIEYAEPMIAARAALAKARGEAQ